VGQAQRARLPRRGGQERETTILVRAHVSDEIAHQLELLRTDRSQRNRLDFVHRGRVRAGDYTALNRVTRAGGADELTIELTNISQPGVDPFRSGANSISADDLVEHGVRALLFGEPLPQQLGKLEFMADCGIDADDLRQAFELPNEYAESVTKLVIIQGLRGRWPGATPD